MKNWWGKIKEHPIYSKVAAGLILAALLAIFNKVFSWNIFSLIFSVAIQKYIVSLWGLMVIAMTSMMLAFGIITFIKFFKDEPSKKVEEELKKQVKTEQVNAQTPWKQYTVDIIEKILWQWKYDYYSGGIDERSLISLCPKCKRELEMERNHYYTSPAFHMKCPNCDFQSDDTSGGIVDFRKKIIKEIEGRIRSGEFQDKIK